jgi:hypothetical protein
MTGGKIPQRTAYRDRFAFSGLTRGQLSRHAGLKTVVMTL